MSFTEVIERNAAVPLVGVSFLLTLAMAVFSLFRLSEDSLEASWPACLMLSSDPAVLVTQPWSIFTYIFVHQSWWHLLANTLWLWPACNVWRSNGSYGLRTVPWILLLAGAFAGGVFYMAAACFGLVRTDMLAGSSAAVLAVVCGISVLAPHARIPVRGLNRIPLPAAAAVIVGVDLICLVGYAPASHCAHLGGAVAGIATAFGLRKLQSGQHKVLHDESHVNDEVLDKLYRSGFASLSPSERDILANGKS